MHKMSNEDLVRAYKNEKNADMQTKLLVIVKYYVDKLRKRQIAGTVIKNRRTIHRWVKRFHKYGIVGLYDRPRSGRPPKVENKKLLQILATIPQPITLSQVYEAIKEQTCTKYSYRQIRNRLHGLGLTVKKLTVVHINKATQQKITRWQRRIKKLIKKLKKRGYTILSLDESIFENEYSEKKRFWAMLGKPAYGIYNGKHQRAITFGAVADNGKQIFRIYKKFNTGTFIEFLNEIIAHFGKKILIIMDKATPHTSKKTVKYIERNNILTEYFPTGTPELNAVEQCWARGKQKLLTSQPYKSLTDFIHAISEYYRTTRFNLDINKYLSRKLLPSLIN